MKRSAELFRIINWLDKMEIKNYSINPDLTVDVDGNVDLDGKGLTEIPVQFGIVRGWFWCNDNQLTSLQGAPREVIRGWFDCSDNQLTTLKGAPREVGGLFWCRNNKQKFTEEEVKAICKVGGSIYV